MTREAESAACYIPGFEEERGPGTKECKQPLGARKGKETASPLETLGESHNPTTPYFSPMTLMSNF